MKTLKIEVFRTNVKNKSEAIKILKELKATFPVTKANFDLDDCDKILRVVSRGNHVNKIETCLKLKGYECELLPD